MKKNDVTEKVDTSKLIDEINLNLNQISKGKVEGITKTLKLIDQFFRLSLADGLITANFFNDAIIKTNSFESLNFTEKKDTNNMRYKKFVDLCLIPTLKTSKDKMEEEEPFKYQTLREISESLLNCLKNKIISYNLITVDGIDEKTCFTSPVGSKPSEIEIRSSVINQNDKLKKRFNPKGSSASSVALSFEKLKALSQIMLTGISERVISEKTPEVTKESKKFEEMNDEISSNVAFKEVDFNEKDKLKLNLQKKQRELQIDNFYQVVITAIDKLLQYAEFETVQKIALYIAKNKNFSKFQKQNYETALGFVSDFGGQKRIVDISSLDEQSTAKLIQSTLKVKKTTYPTKFDMLLNK